MRWVNKMISVFKKEAEDTEDINSWIFEQDIKQIFMKGYEKKPKTILYVITFFLLLGVFLCCYVYYKSIWKAVVAVFFPVIVGIIAGNVLLKILSWLWKWKIVKMYWPVVVFPMIALIAVILFINNIQLESNLPLQKSDILGFCGDYIVFLGSFYLGYFIYCQDREKRVEEKRSKVRLLLAQVENANTELLRMNRLYRYTKRNQIPEEQVLMQPIPNDPNWMILYLEYESLKGTNSDLKNTLILFFDNIARVNDAIGKGKLETAVKINEQYIEGLMYSTQKYNELEAITRLMGACDDSNFFNTKSWLERKETVDLINELCRKYYLFIEDYIYSWLLKYEKKTTTEEDDLCREVTDWLLNNFPEIQEKIRFPDQKRIISRVVFDCSCKFSQKSKKVDYVWGEYSLKEISAV